MQLEFILREILKHSAQQGGNRGVNLRLLESVWPWLVGHDMARRTRPVSWRAKTLHIEVSSYAWVQELSFHREELLARIKRLFPWPLDELKLTVSERFEPLLIDDEAPLIQGLSAARMPKRPLWDEGLIDEHEVEQDLEALDEETRASLLRIRKLASGQQ